MPKEENPVVETPYKEDPTGESQTQKQETDKAMSGEGDEKPQEKENLVQEQSDVEEENPIEKHPVREKPFGENPIVEKPIEEIPFGEKQENSKQRGTSEEESSTDGTYEVRSYKEDEIDYEILSWQMIQAEIKEAGGKTLKETPNGETQSQEKGKLCQEEEEEGFNFQHLQVLQKMPISAFYGVDLCDLSQLLKPLEKCTFYGNDEASLAAENAKLDVFYKNMNRVQAVCENDLLLIPSISEEEDDETNLMNLVEERGENPKHQDFTSAENYFSLSRLVWEQNQDSDVNPGGVNFEPDGHAEANFNVDQEVYVFKDQDQEMFLFPESTSEEEDNIQTLRTLLNYKQVAGILTSYDQTGATPSQHHPLLRLINSYSGKQGPITGPHLVDKLLKLQIRYKMLVEELGENPTDEEISKHSKNLFFRLSRRVWGKGPEL